MGRNNFFDNLKIFLVLLGVSLFIYFLDANFRLDFFHQKADFLSTPLKKNIYEAYRNFFLKENQEKEIEKLKLSLLSLEEKNRQLERENKILRKQLETPLPPQWEYQDAKVIGYYLGLNIDKGKNAGLKEGQVALIENILVGKIKNLSQNQAEVILPTDPELKIPVITKETKARGILKGEYLIRAVLTNVLQEEKLKKGDLLLTTGEGGFPSGLLVGKIKKVEKEETELYQKAEVEMLLDYKDLERVFILMKY